MRRQIAVAVARGWQGAARRLGEEMAAAIRRFQVDVEVARQVLETHAKSRRIVTPSEIYQDLLALQEEFHEVDVDLKERELSVTTESIVLEGIELGRFDIRLEWQRLGDRQPYRVVARDPNPAQKNDEVTHPHVQSETLCEGEGRTAIQAALGQGRLYDFFLLVSNVLRTYARGSGYVELADWSGITCEDCGTTMSADDSYGCQRCGSQLCEDCQRSCAGCEESHCSGCLSQCPECEMDFCRSCLETCPECHRTVCGGCIEDGLCLRCQEEQSPKEEENDDHDDESIQRTDEPPVGPASGDKSSEGTCPVGGNGATDEQQPEAAAESHRLGETLVSA
jgi:hypothetical protein